MSQHVLKLFSLSAITIGLWSNRIFSDGEHLFPKVPEGRSLSSRSWRDWSLLSTGMRTCLVSLNQKNTDPLQAKAYDVKTMGVNKPTRSWWKESNWYFLECGTKRKCVKQCKSHGKDFPFSYSDTERKVPYEIQI